MIKKWKGVIMKKEYDFSKSIRNPYIDKEFKK